MKRRKQSANAPASGSGKSSSAQYPRVKASLVRAFHKMRSERRGPVWDENPRPVEVDHIVDEFMFAARIAEGPGGAPGMGTYSYIVDRLAKRLQLPSTGQAAGLVDALWPHQEEDNNIDAKSLGEDKLRARAVSWLLNR